MSDENTVAGQNANNPAAAQPTPVAPDNAGQSAANPNPAPAAQQVPAGTTQGEPNKDGLLSGTNPNGGSGEGANPSEKPVNEPEGNPTLGAPEDGYTFEQLPEGTDQSIVEQWKAQAKELNLSQDASQKMLNAGLEGLLAKHAEQRSQLREAALADKELDFKNSGADIKNAFEAYLKPNASLLQKLSQYNLDVDPDFLRFMRSVGKDISSSGRFVQGSKVPENDPSDFRGMFPNTTMNR